MIEVLFFSVLTAGFITEILYKKIEKYKPIIISFSVALVLTLLCTHVLPELFSVENNQLGYYLLAGLLFKYYLNYYQRGLNMVMFTFMVKFQLKN